MEINNLTANEITITSLDYLPTASSNQTSREIFIRVN